MRHLAVVLALQIGLWSASAQAATYLIDIDFGPERNDSLTVIGNGQLTGTIVTDGSTGALTGSNILSWSFTYGVPGVVTQTIDSNGIAGVAQVLSNGSMLFVDGADLTLRALSATTSRLDFRNEMLRFSIAPAVTNANNVFLFVTLPTSSPVFTDTMGVTVPQNTVIGRVPVPAALPLALTGLAALGLLGWRRRSAQAVG